MNFLQIVELVVQGRALVKPAHPSSPPYHSPSAHHPSSHRASRTTRRIVSITFIAISLISTMTLVPQAQGLSQNDAIAAALGWLSSHQLSDGSYGAFTEPQTAPAAYALWIKSSDSATVLLSFGWLKNQQQNSSSWFWGGGGNIAEADVPGEILYSFAQTNNLQMLTRLNSVATNLTSYQQKSGGFLGYEDPTFGKVTSSVDTAMAMLGLIGANRFSASNETAAANYLLTLQNSDGSFNLTKTTNANSLYSLGPDPISITALVLLALNAAQFSKTNSHVMSSLSYLTSQETNNFNGHVYAASLSLLAFTEYSDPNDASLADHYILTQQNPDGGFRDISRGTTSSTALDTGWAAVSLQIGGSFCCSINGGGGGTRRMAV